jgi:hypothetical protein
VKEFEERRFGVEPFFVHQPSLTPVGERHGALPSGLAEGGGRDKPTKNEVRDFFQKRRAIGWAKMRKPAKHAACILPLARLGLQLAVQLPRTTI